MTATTATAARAIPRTPADEAFDIARAELAAALALLRTLDADDWRRPTACTGWTVHDVVAHMIGQAEELARPDRMIRRVRRARRAGNTGVLDRHNGYQVQDRRHTPDQQLITELDRWTRKGVQAVRRMPAPVRRRVRLSLVFPEAKQLPEDSFDYLARVLIARDPWMHRMDIAAATGRSPILDRHDAQVTEQVVHDLALSWTGPTVILDLSGPAGGRWTLGTQPPVATVHSDAISYMRLLSGRLPDSSPTTEGDHTAAQALLATRIDF